MKFSRMNKAEQLTRSFDASLHGTIYSGLVAAVLEINDQYTDNKQYFYNTDDEHLITASNLIYTCGTDKLASILNRMEDQLGYKYEQGIEKLMDELIQLSKRVPMELLEDIPTNFSHSINFGILTDFIGGTLKMRGMSRGIGAVQSTKLYKGLTRKSAQGQAIEKAEHKITRANQSDAAAANKVNKVQSKVDAFKNEHQREWSKTKVKEWKQEQKKVNAAAEAINKPKDSIKSTDINRDNITSHINKPDNKINPSGNTEQAQRQARMERDAQRRKDKVQDLKTQQNSAQNSSTAKVSASASSSKQNKVDLNKQAQDLSQELKDVKAQQAEINAKNEEIAKQAIADKELAKARRSTKDAALDKLKGGVDAGLNLMKMGGETYGQAAIWGGGMDAIMNRGSKNTAEEVTEAAAGKVVDTSKQLSKVNYR